MAEAPPLAAPDIARRLSDIVAPAASGLVLAVSGGPDSMALMVLVAGLRGSGSLPPITVATVDHGLRPGSACDAAFVMAAAARLDLPSQVLVWEGPKPGRAIQERARAARYRLLTGFCTAIGADHLATAHTLDDQAETVLFRLLRGSGVGGLAGMDDVTSLGGINLVRPLLGDAKARLVATCRACGLAFLEDPSNRDPRFARARMRRLLPVLAGEGLDAMAIQRLARRLRRADEALDHAAAAASLDCRIAAPVPTLDGRRMAGLPRETAIRVLGRAIAMAGGRTGRLDRLEHLAERIASAAADGAALRTTLGGVLVTLSPNGGLTLASEAPRRRGNRTPTPTPLAMATTIAACGNDHIAGFPWQA